MNTFKKISDLLDKIHNEEVTKLSEEILSELNDKWHIDRLIFILENELSARETFNNNN